MIEQAAREHGLDLKRSWMVGDILDDVEAGHRAGCRSILVDRGHEDIWELNRLRAPDHIVTGLAAAAKIVRLFDRSFFRRKRNLRYSNTASRT